MKRIELTFLKCPKSDRILTADEISTYHDRHISINLGALLKRTDGYIKTLECLCEDHTYYQPDSFLQKLLELLVEELVALAIHSSTLRGSFLVYRYSSRWVLHPLNDNVTRSLQLM